MCAWDNQRIWAAVLLFFLLTSFSAWATTKASKSPEKASRLAVLRISDSAMEKAEQTTASLLPDEPVLLPLPPQGLFLDPEPPVSELLPLEQSIHSVVVIALPQAWPERNTFSDWPVVLAKDVTRTLQQQTSVRVLSPDEWDRLVRMYGLKASSDKVLASCRNGGNPDIQELRYLLEGMRLHHEPIDALVLVEGIVDRQHRLDPTDENKWVWLQRVFQTSQPDAYYRLEGMVRLIQPRVSPAPAWERRASFGLPYERLTTVTASVYDEPNNGYVLQHQAKRLSQQLLAGFPLLSPEKTIQGQRDATRVVNRANTLKQPAVIQVKAGVQQTP